MSDRSALTLVGNIGDLNPLDYGGGIVFVDAVGYGGIEWYEPESEDDEDCMITVYRVDIDHGAEDWMDLGSVAKTCDHASIREDIESNNLMVRACAFWSVAGHWGWGALDHDPCRLTRAEAETRLKAVKEEQEAGR